MRLRLPNIPGAHARSLPAASPVPAALSVAALLLALSAAAPAGAAGHPPATAVEALAEARAAGREFCPIGGCGAGRASPMGHAAGFAAAVAAVVWRRRRG